MFSITLFSKSRRPGQISSLLLLACLCLAFFTCYSTAHSRSYYASKSGEFQIDTMSANYPAQYPAIATGNNQSLVVWRSYRRPDGCTNATDICASRLSGTGSVLDPDGIVVGLAQAVPSFAHNAVDVSFDGTNYMAVWSSGGDIFAARVGSDGVVLDPDGILVADDDYERACPVIAFDGVTYLVVYQSKFIPSSNRYAIKGQRISPAGTLVGSEIIINDQDNDHLYPKIAYAGGYLVVWQDGASASDDIRAARVSSSGVVLDPTGFDVSIGSLFHYKPEVAYGAGNFMTSWWDDREEYRHYDIYGARISTSGSVLDPSGLVLWDQDYIEWLYGSPNSSIAFDGTNFMIVHDVSSEINGMRIDPSGSTIDVGGFTISEGVHTPGHPDVSFDGYNYFVVWHEDRTGWLEPEDVYLMRVNKSGYLMNPEDIRVSPPAAYQSQRNTVCASDGRAYLVAWESNGMGYEHDYDLFYYLIDSLGETWSDEPLGLSRAVDSQLTPAIAPSSDGRYLVAWEDKRSGTSDIYGARISYYGYPYDCDGIPISTAANRQYDPHACWGDSTWLVVFSDRRQPSLYSSLYTNRVTSDGTVLDNDDRQLVFGGWDAAVAHDGSAFLVACIRVNLTNVSIHCYFLDEGTGQAIDPNGFNVTTSTHSKTSPQLAFDGENYLLVWADRRYSGNVHYDILGTRIAIDGTILDPDLIQICVAEEDQVSPQVIFDGYHWIVSWLDERDGLVRGIRMKSTGRIFDTLILAEQPSQLSVPSLAAGPDKTMLLTYDGMTSGVVDGNSASAWRSWGNLMEVASCCEGMTGNVDDDSEGLVDIGDLTLLIDYLFVSFEEPPCLDEGQTDSTEGVDIGDLTMMIDYLFISFEDLRDCP